VPTAEEGVAFCGLQCACGVADAAAGCDVPKFDIKMMSKYKHETGNMTTPNIT